MIINNFVETIVNSTTKKYYQELGYNAIVKEKLKVKIEDLKDNSCVYEERKCDNCGKTYGSTHQALLKSFKIFNEDVCPECVKTEKYKKIQNEHRKNTNFVKYGASAPAKNDEIKNKMENTNIKKYGVKSTLLDKETKEKIKNTLLKKYGVDSPLKNEEILNKVKNTNLAKYGHENPQQNLEVQQKTTITNLEKYGVKYTTQVPEVRKKMRESLYKHGTVATSSQQHDIYNKVLKMFGENEVSINKPVDTYSLDVELLYNDKKIDIEYDGQYWHQDKEKDDKRDEEIIKRGYKILRIKSKSKVPTEEELKNSIYNLMESDKKIIFLILSDYDL